MAACQVFATEAAICILKNENEQAFLKINESLKNIPKILDKGLGIALTERLNLLRNKIEKVGLNSQKSSSIFNLF